MTELKVQLERLLSYKAKIEAQIIDIRKQIAEKSGKRMFMKREQNIRQYEDDGVIYTLDLSEFKHPKLRDIE